MRYRRALIASTWPIAAVAMAAPAQSHFTLKDRRQDTPANPLNQPPPSANDMAAVMGEDRPWQNGRPPVDRASAPMDPACH